MEAATVAAPTVVPRPHDSLAARIGRLAGRLPFQILMAVIGLLWLVPTFGLLLTSLMPAGKIADEGWWKVVAHPQLDAKGEFHAPLKLHAGGYRVTVDGDGRLAAATAHVHVTSRLLASLGY